MLKEASLKGNSKNIGTPVRNKGSLARFCRLQKCTNTFVLRRKSFVRPSVCLSNRQTVCLSAYMYRCLSFYPSVTRTKKKY
jgi:hypothetical protein